MYNNNDFEYIVKLYRVYKGFYMFIFEGINNINDIEYLKGSFIY